MVKVINSVPVAFSISGKKYSSRFVTFSGLSENVEHFAIKLGPDVNSKVPLVRIHSECLTGDVFESLHCDCGFQLRHAVKMIYEEGGYILYLRQEGRGIGLYAKLLAYSLQQNQGLSTFEANNELGFPDDMRMYHSAAEMLEALGVASIRLITHNPEKLRSLINDGIDVVEQILTESPHTKENSVYLADKREYFQNLKIS